MATITVLDTKLSRLQQHVHDQDTKITVLDTKITVLDTKLSRLQQDVDDQFNIVHERFNTFEQDVRDQFSIIDERFASIDKRFDVIDKKFVAVDNRFNRLEALVKNSNATSSWSAIIPIPYEDCIPLRFPDRVVKFWHLKDLGQRHLFTELLQFYHVLDEDETNLSFEEYVHQILTEAHARLAEAWGMNYPAIALQMEILEQRRQQEERAQPQTRNLKRGPDKETVAERYASRAVPVRSSNSSHSAYTMLKSPPPPPSPKPDSDVVRWETDSEARALRQRLKARSGRQPPQAQHEHSPAVKPVSTSPSLAKSSPKSDLGLSPTQRISRSSDSEGS